METALLNNELNLSYPDGFHVMSREELRAAQQHPELYHNLVVRIAGYSAYFVDMTEAMQNDIIARAEHVF